MESLNERNLRTKKNQPFHKSSFNTLLKNRRVDSLDYQKKIIDIFHDRIVLTYNYKGGTETIFLKDIEGSDLFIESPPNKLKGKLR